MMSPSEAPDRVYNIQCSSEETAIPSPPRAARVPSRLRTTWIWWEAMSYKLTTGECPPLALVKYTPRGVAVHPSE